MTKCLFLPVADFSTNTASRVPVSRFEVRALKKCIVFVHSDLFFVLTSLGAAAAFDLMESPQPAQKVRDRLKAFKTMIGA